MNLTPLFAEKLIIQVHAFAAIAALVLGAIQFLAPKGTVPHRVLGYAWVVLMLVIAVSSFWIHEIRLLGPFSPIHFLSISTLILVPMAVVAARSKKSRSHRLAMIQIYIFALITAGAFTLLPGRVMHSVVFG